MIFAIIDDKYPGKTLNQIIKAEFGELKNEIDYEKLVEDVLAKN